MMQTELCRAFTNADFEREVLGNEGVVLVDFWAPWCGPCRMIAPALDAISAEMGDKVKIVKVNVDENPELARTFGVMSIPTLTLVKGGNTLMRAVGAQSKQALKQQILDSLGKNA